MHVIGTAGHVDHGKSTLVQRLTGIDPDRFAEEKRRGLTIDLGFAWFTLPSGSEVGMVDVPGHERFIANMLAGAGGISVCLFVVAANEGWMPQSSEHLAIVDILGIEHGVVALTKSDTVDAARRAEATRDIIARLEGTSLGGAPVVEVSAITGDGIDDLVAELDRVVAAAPPSVDAGRPRLWIDRVFTISGAGTVVTGTLAGGSLSTGDDVEISPEGRAARIRKIQSHKKEVDSIAPGNRVALNLANLERQGAERGDAVVTAGGWTPTDRVDALIRVLPGSVLDEEHELTDKGSHLMYTGSAETPVRVKLLEGDKLRSGEEGLAQLHLRDALPLARGDRFVLRDAGRVLTFGGGVIADPAPPQARRGDASHTEVARALATAEPVEAVRILVTAHGEIGRAEAARRAGTQDIPAGVIELGDALVSATRMEALTTALDKALAEHHRNDPLAKGVPREALRAQLELDPPAFEALLESAPGVTADGTTVSAASHRVSLAPEQEEARARLLTALDSSGFSPPLTKDLGVDDKLLRALVDAGDITRVGDFYLSATAAAEARSKVRGFIETNGPVTVAQIRDLLGTSRKYAVPLCEWLDDTGATIRRADLRHLGPHP